MLIFLQDHVVAVLLGVLGFICAWAAKHALDSLALPHVRIGLNRARDWWALQNVARSRAKGESLLNALESDLDAALDPAWLIIKLYKDIAFLAVAGCMVLGLWLGTPRTIQRCAGLVYH